jgi:hypothetical protein
MAVRMLALFVLLQQGKDVGRGKILFRTVQLRADLVILSQATVALPRILVSQERWSVKLPVEKAL